MRSSSSTLPAAATFYHNLPPISTFPTEATLASSQGHAVIKAETSYLRHMKHPSSTSISSNENLHLPAPRISVNNDLTTSKKKYRTMLLLSESDSDDISSTTTPPASPPPPTSSTRTLSTPPTMTATPLAPGQAKYSATRRKTSRNTSHSSSTSSSTHAHQIPPPKKASSKRHRSGQDQGHLNTSSGDSKGIAGAGSGGSDPRSSKTRQRTAIACGYCRRRKVSEIR